VTAKPNRSKQETVAAAPLPPGPVQQLVARTVSAIPPSGIRDFFDIVQGMQEVISLGIGEPDFVTPWHIREAAIYALEHGRTGYTSNLGLLRLRQAIAVGVEKNFHVAYNPAAEILVTVGVSEAMDLAFRALLNPGDDVIYHEPCYVSYAPGIALAYGVPVPVSCRAEEGFSLTAAAIEKVVTPRSKVLVLNFPTNPTGATMSRAQLLAIAQLACRRNLLVITDEIYSELTFEGQHVSIASLPGMKERTLFLHGFSKAYAMTGFRIGYACGPEALIEAMMRIHQYSMLCASVISQEAALEAIEHGEADTAEMREQYRLRRNFMIAALNDMGLACHAPRGSFYAFPSVKSTGMTSKEFALALLQSRKVACVPGSAFGPAGEGYVRCCFATGMDRITEAMERMAQFVKERR
jgi:aminotransferase